MLEKIGVPKEIAQEDACRIEHVISEETFEAIQNFYKQAEEETASSNSVLTDEN